MRLLILLLALSSAFFVSADVLDNLYDMNDLKPPKSDGMEICISAFGNEGCGSDLQKAFDNSCAAYNQVYELPTSTPDRKFTKSECETGKYQPKLKVYAISRCPDCQGGWSPEQVSRYQSVNYSNQYERKNWYCPPEGFPEHENSVTIEPAPTDPLAPTFMCAKLLVEPEPELDPDCPAPTDNDPFVFGSGGGQTSVCFPAQNGRQCAIQTDENGGYYIPASYGSAEPVSCTPDIDPSPDPDPTPDPEPKPDPDPTDPEPEANELDAINKINENLDVLNQNQSASSESNDERLDRIALEIQNSNELLSAIKGKPVSGGGSNINNGALTEIAENTKPKEFNFNANRKQGGLNDIFTGDDLAQVEQEIEDKKTELADYIEKIKSESKAIFDINTNISGSYTEHKETIKGAEVDLGVGRFSGFFQIIAPALIFVATVAALFIMLGGNKE